MQGAASMKLPTHPIRCRLQYIGLAGIMYNLTLAVGLAVCYNATHA